MNFSEFTARSEAIKKRLYTIALLHLGSEDMAIDVLSEAIYKGLKSIKKLRNDDFFETWLTRILINECNMDLRR